MGIRYANFMPISNHFARRRAALCPLIKCYHTLDKICILLVVYYLILNAIECGDCVNVQLLQMSYFGVEKITAEFGIENPHALPL